MPNSVWKRLRMVLASEKSSLEPARWGCVAYTLDAARALSVFGVELAAGVLELVRLFIIVVDGRTETTSRALSPSGDGDGIHDLPFAATTS